MIETLQRAVDRASNLSPEVQSRLAALLVEEIESDASWDASFARSPHALAALAEEALRDEAEGRTVDADRHLL